MMILLVFLGAVGLGVAAAEQQAAAPQLLKIAAGPAGNESSGVIPLFGGACQVQSFDGSRSDRVLPVARSSGDPAGRFSFEIIDDVIASSSHGAH